VGLAKEEKSKRVALFEEIQSKKHPFEKVASKKGHIFVIYRVLAHCFEISYAVNDSSDHSFVLIFWQLFFNLYFESKCENDKIEQFGSFFLDIAQSRDIIFSEIIERMTDLSAFYKKKADDDEKYSFYETIYYAMNLWMKNTEKNASSFIEKIPTLPDYYQTKYLLAIIKNPLFGDYTALIIPKENNHDDYVSLSNIYPSLYLKSITKKKSGTQRKKAGARISYIPQDEIKQSIVCKTNQIFEKFKNNIISINNV
jgi:hypothetical protein